ncbi:MAG: fused 4-phosphopantothenoylcysteine decarboxylase [Pseudomonadota bacterium]|jgi:phosphopantothenoylcysteine decarboxylase/phosphopantothenate--cysteine ligase
MSARVLLVIGGGIAAYKCLDLVRRLRERGVEVRCVMTEAATRFVTPLAVSAISGQKAYTDLFDVTDELDVGHIRLSRESDLIVVAPATADLMARMAGGHAGDLATAVLLATDKPVLAAPAMNPRMWLHPATRRNLAQLQADGIQFIGPNTGEMAEKGEAGPGRMAEPLEIADRVMAMLSGSALPAAAAVLSKGPLSGRHVLVTAGPTHEPIDPVRFIANRSSGKQGYAIAEAAARAGARVTLVSGPVNIAAPQGCTVVRVETASEMLEAVRNALPADVAIMTAAVADWRVANAAVEKIKKAAGKKPAALKLAENPDILRTVASMKSGRPALVIGFAAETEHVVRHAEEKRKRKGCDWIVANDVSPETGVMGGDRNRVHLVTEDDTDAWPEMGKDEVASRLVELVADRLRLAGADV